MEWIFVYARLVILILAMEFTKNALLDGLNSLYWQFYDFIG